jgi:decaprenylphospho-beta-D-erythro-pentofuranosid-2-ulose 2-reductase
MERVLVFGATSAVAAEVIAIHLQRGDRLHLIARSAAKRDALIARFNNSPNLTSTLADLDRLDSNDLLVRDGISALGGLDRVLIAHGLLGDQLDTEKSFAAAEATLRTNFTSVVSLLIPLANHLETQRAGRICVITSVAGDRGRPRNYTYGTAKGALNLYLQGLRSRLWPAGVKITTLKLGPVDTPMTTAHKKNALFSTPDKVAASIVRAMDRGAGEVYVPSFWALIMLLVRNAPEWLFQRASFVSGR